MAALYTAHATTIGGRNGHTETDDKNISLDLSTPGGNKPGSNPEQLFACGYSACFGGAVEFAAKQQKVDIGGAANVKADVTLHKDDTGFSISVILNVALPNVSQPQAEELVQLAHTICPYSKATRGNIDVKLQANGQSLAKAA